MHLDKKKCSVYGHDLKKSLVDFVSNAGNLDSTETLMSHLTRSSPI